MELYEFNLIEFTGYLQDEYGSPIQIATITATVVGSGVSLGFLLPTGGGIYSGTIAAWLLPPGTYLVEFTAKPESDNYEPATFTWVLVVQPFYTHW